MYSSAIRRLFEDRHGKELHHPQEALTVPVHMHRHREAALAAAGLQEQARGLRLIAYECRQGYCRAQTMLFAKVASNGFSWRPGNNVRGLSMPAAHRVPKHGASGCNEFRNPYRENSDARGRSATTLLSNAAICVLAGCIESPLVSITAMAVDVITTIS